jgi:AcrR family transcriptional regulator
MTVSGKPVATSEKTGTRPRTARRSKSAVERILAAADKLFYLHGIRAVGVDAVAEEADVSKRTLYNHFQTKDDLIAAYLVGRFKHMAPSDAPARDQILGYFDHLEREFARPDFRGCAYVNAVSELCDPKHPAATIALQFKEQRRAWYRKLLERLNVADPDALATQLQLLAEGALSANLVWGDPTLARAARDAAAALIDAAMRQAQSRRAPRESKRRERSRATDRSAR